MGSTRTCFESGSRSAPRHRSLPPTSRPAFIPVQLEGTADRALSRQDSVATVDLPAACDDVRGSEPKGATAFCSPAKVSVVPAERCEALRWNAAMWMH